MDGSGVGWEGDGVNRVYNQVVSMGKRAGGCTGAVGKW